MYHQVFLDTNVVLDFVLDRDPFVKEAQKIFLLHESERIAIHTSALTLANVAYIVRRNGKNPFKVIERLLFWIYLIDLERSHFEKNLRSQFKDFEDGLQFYAASEINGVDAIITRDKADFKYADIPVLTPKEFLKQFEL